jgi:1,4-dihydroxy-2-naphthoate octaprenyltransferase
MIKAILKATKPINLVLAALSYCLGISITRYLGNPGNLISYGGGVSILSLVGATYLFDDYFRSRKEKPARGIDLILGTKNQVTLLQVAFALLALSAISTFILFYLHFITITSAILYGVLFFIFFAYAIPPFHLSIRGFGELLMAISYAALIPSFSSMTQSSPNFRLLSFVTFPLFLLAITYFLIGNFQTYVTDQKIGNKSLLGRLTWQRAIPIHHLFIFGAFSFIAISPFLQYPWGLVWPVLLALPLGIAQVIWLQHLANGGRPYWALLVPLSSVTFGMTIYLTMMAFLLR